MMPMKLEKKNGIKERNKTTERKSGIEQIAKQLLKMNKPIEEIIEITGLEKTQIEKIRDEK